MMQQSSVLETARAGASGRPSLLPCRPALALLAVVALSWSTGPSGGMYSHAALLLALVALGLALAACLLPEKPWSAAVGLGPSVLHRGLLLLAVLGGFQCVWKTDAVAAVVSVAALALLALVSRRPPRADSPAEACLVAAAVLLSGIGVFTAEVLYGAPGGLRTPLMVAAAGAGFVLSAAWLFDSGRWFRARLLLVFVAAAVLRVSAILASPEPIVDVYVALRDAPQHLLQGQNPYTAAYPDPYDTDRASEFGFTAAPSGGAYALYPPLPFLLALPFRAAGLDVRYANVLCDLLAGLVLLAAGWIRAGPRAGALFAGIYLFLPRVPFLIEHAWYEPMLAALLGGGLVLAGRGNWTGYVLLGLGLTGKQFGLLLLFPLAKAEWRRWPLLLLGFVAAGLLFVPFLLWDSAAFFDVPQPLLLVVAMGLIGWLTWKTLERSPAAALWMGTALLVFCLCHKQAYFNYFYLCQYLMLLGIADLIPQENPGEAAASQGR